MATQIFNLPLIGSLRRKRRNSKIKNILIKAIGEYNVVIIRSSGIITGVISWHNFKVDTVIRWAFFICPTDH